MSIKVRVIPFISSDMSNVENFLRCYTEDGQGSMMNGTFHFTCEPEGAEYLSLQMSLNDVNPFYTDIPKSRRILFLIETENNAKLPLPFLNQFGVIMACYPIDGYEGKMIVTNPQIGYFAGVASGRYTKHPPLFSKLSDAYDYQCPEKTKMISMITSLTNTVEGHEKRLRFMRKLMERFKDRIDFYGRELQPIDDKLEALAPYKYTVAVENEKTTNYWTEKLADAWIGWSLPLYYGDPLIMDKIPDKDGIVLIDIDDETSAIDTIEKILSEDPYHSRIDAIKRCREWAIAKINPYAQACAVIDSMTKAEKEEPMLEEPILISRPFRRRGRDLRWLLNKLLKLLGIRWRIAKRNGALCFLPTEKESLLRSELHSDLPIPKIK